MTHYNDIEADLIEFDGEDERNSRLYPRHEWRGFTRRRINLRANFGSARRSLPNPELLYPKHRYRGRCGSMSTSVTFEPY